MFSGMSMFTQGLVVAALGLAGTFLILTLVYVLVRILRRSL